MAEKAGHSRTCSGIIGVCVLSITIWLGYTICLLVQSVPVIQGFHEYRNSPNTSIALSTQVPLIVDPQYFLQWMNGLLVLIYLPQYLLAIVYVAAMSAAFADFYCRKNIRAQFITAFTSSVMSMSFFLSFAASLLTIVLCIYMIRFTQYTFKKISQIMTINQNLGAPIDQSDIAEMDEFDKKCTTGFQWLSAELFFSVMMFLIYLIYFCYWPQSLRSRNYKERYATKIGPQDSEDDL